MTKDALALVLVLTGLCSCVRRDGRNSDCRWPGEVGAKPLDALRAGAQRHLSKDAEFAEDLAIRYADTNHGTDSGNFVSGEAYAAERNRCLEALIEEIAKAHGVQPASVLSSLGKNRLRMDLAINLPFVLLFVLVAYGIVVRLRFRYPPGSGWAGPLTMLGLASLLASLGGYLVGEQWATLVEMARIGNGHLSYRTDRVPWVQFPVQFISAGLVLFWVIAAIVFWPKNRSNQ